MSTKPLKKFKTLFPRVIKQLALIFERPVIGLSREKRARVAAHAPELAAVWQSLITRYFPERHDLLNYRMSWSSRRQKRTLASCNVSAKRVVVARELKHPDCSQFIDPLLYHELCHAVLGDRVGYHRGKRAWHGPEFRALEARHPGIALLNRWIKEGGWRHAVRSDRSRTAAHARKTSYKQ